MGVRSTPTAGATTDESQNFQPQNLLGDMKNAVTNVYNTISYHMGGNKPKALSCGDMIQGGILIVAVLALLWTIISPVLWWNTATKVGNIGYHCMDFNHRTDVEKNMLELTLKCQTQTSDMQCCVYLSKADVPTGEDVNKGIINAKQSRGKLACGNPREKNVFLQVPLNDVPADENNLRVWCANKDDELSHKVSINTPAKECKDGVDGKPGEKGSKGDPGIPGKDGVDGKTGEQGIQGLKGDKGERGNDGMGLTGPQGLKGDKGDKGETGDKGEDGIQGIQGVKGEKGDKGERGAVGKDGEKGVAGNDGVQGPPGQVGVQGTKGDKGETGEKGDQGDDGGQGKHPWIKHVKEQDVDLGGMDGHTVYATWMLPNGTAILHGGDSAVGANSPRGDTLAIDVETGVSRRLSDGPRQYYHDAYVFVETFFCTFRGYLDYWGNKNQPACMNMETQEWVETETTGDVGPNPDEAWIGQAVTQVNASHVLLFNGQNLHTYPETCQYLQLKQQDPLQLKRTNIYAKGDVPRGREKAATVSFKNGSILIHGGAQVDAVGRPHFDDMYRFDPETTTYSKVNPVSSETPPKMRRHTMAVYNFDEREYVVLYGGFLEDNSILNDVWMFDVFEITWHKVLTGFGRAKHGMVLFKNYMYALPGISCKTGTTCKSNEEKQFDGSIQVFELEPDLEMTQNELEELREETEDLKEEVDVLSKKVSAINPNEPEKTHCIKIANGPQERWRSITHGFDMYTDVDCTHQVYPDILPTDEDGSELCIGRAAVNVNGWEPEKGKCSGAFDGDSNTFWRPGKDLTEDWQSEVNSPVDQDAWKYWYIGACFTEAVSIKCIKMNHMASYLAKEETTPENALVISAADTKHGPWKKIEGISTLKDDRVMINTGYDVISVDKWVAHLD